MCNIELEKKDHFNLGEENNSCKIVISRRYTNIFITLIDLDNRTIICKTSGSSGVKGNKRRKRSPQSIKLIMNEIYIYLQLYEIQNIEMLINFRRNIFYRIVLRELKSFGISVTGFTVRRYIAHNGVRDKKVRRV